VELDLPVFRILVILFERQDLRALVFNYDSIFISRVKLENVDIDHSIRVLVLQVYTFKICTVVQIRRGRLIIGCISPTKINVRIHPLKFLIPHVLLQQTLLANFKGIVVQVILVIIVDQHMGHPPHLPVVSLASRWLLSVYALYVLTCLLAQFMGVDSLTVMLGFSLLLD
jgi:hypothetical protein